MKSLLFKGKVPAWVICLLAFLASSLGISAQESDYHRYSVRYVQNDKLFVSGDNAWVTSMNLEWPQILGSNPLPALQHELTSFLFHRDAASLTSGLRQLYASMGKEMQKMPDKPSLQMHYLDCKLSLLAYEEGRFVSLEAYRQERLGDDSIVSTDKKVFTFSIPANRILRQEDIFNQHRLFHNSDQSIRVAFETLLDNGSFVTPSDYEKIDLTKVPQDFALLKDGLFLFDLGGPRDHSNYSLVSRTYLPYFISKKGKALLDAPAVVTSMSSDSCKLYAFSEDSLLGVCALPDSFPDYPGGNTALATLCVKGLQLAEGVNYPSGTVKVILSFILNADGTPSDMGVIAPYSPDIDRQLVNQLRQQESWRPGKKGGKAVPVRVNVPMIFRFG